MAGPQSQSAEAGFSVLEALVAIAILTAGLLPLLALQGQFVKTVESLERAERQMTADNIVRAHIQALNLVDSREGEINLGDIMARWEAKPVFGPDWVRDNGGMASRYQVTLYDVTVTYNGVSQTTRQMQLQGMGWEAKRPFLSGL